MSRIAQLFLLCCAIGTLSVLGGGAAVATPITGMVGVGTWNTQAEFADVKVVQGTTTLYQSDFATGMSGFTALGGTWETANGYLRQTSGATPALALVGSTSWGSYTLTLKARKISGSEGFVIAFGSPGDATKSWWNIGGWGNTQHALEVPSTYAAAVAGSIQTGRWYDIRVQLSGADIRCYLDGLLIHDTSRLLDTSDWDARFQRLISSNGFGLLNAQEQQRLRDLAARSVYLGAAARATLSAMPSTLSFRELNPANQGVVIRKVNRNRLTWNLGWGYDGIDPARRQTIIDSMDGAVMLHNSLGLFDKHVVANNSPGTPTADAGYDGQIRFGGSYNYRVALHELEHCLGVGTTGNWTQSMVNGAWTGQYANALLAQLDGAGAVVHGDTQHFWPYGLNYDNESSTENDRRHVLVVAALRRDMGIATYDVTGATSFGGGIYRLTPRLAPNSALDVQNANPNNAAQIDIRAYTGTDGQRFYLDLQSDGTYRIRTVLTGNRCVELPSGVTDNGTMLRLWDDNGNAAQRWYLIPTGDGWYRIAPRNNVFKSMDLTGISTADGTAVESWDFWDGFGQQWALSLLTPAFTTQDLSRALAIAGGLSSASASDLSRLNAAKGAGTAMIDSSDAVAIARRLTGLEPNP